MPNTTPPPDIIKVVDANTTTTLPSDLCDDDDDVICLTELGHQRILVKKAWAEVRRAWDIIDEQDVKLHLLEQNNRTLQSIVSDLSQRSGILVISPAFKGRKRVKS